MSDVVTDALADDAPHLLVIDDDARIRSLLSRYLNDNGFRVDVAANAAEARTLLGGLAFDLLVVDVMMPGENGLDLLRSLRETMDVPILMLTARAEIDSRIKGLELGADDYLGKPFNPRELLARIRARLRRSLIHERPSARRRAVGELIIDLDGRAISTRSGTVVGLTTAEYDLLACFIEHPRRVLSRDQLLDWTRGRTADPLDRTIDVTVSRLRARLAPVAPSVVQAITTVRNGGYLFAMPVEDA